CQQYNSIPYSF
nr:immunoglobulin light chain junction region [Macaca mulatta]MOV82475.1 immunoglobulin light chain junction region [Macaca mulatta]